MEILKIKPCFVEKMWGGQELKKFGYQIPKDKKIGEAWIISAHENGMSYVDKDQSLKEFFEMNRNLFGDYQGEFPLLVKILTPSDYLSVQVHPDDSYARLHNDSLGKPESWYVLEAPDNAEIIYGHHAKTHEELESMVINNEWDQLLKKVPVKRGDFIYVDAGKIHALTPGVVVYELQRSSDVTYRFYDFNRIDKDGTKRRLDLADSLAVTKVPDSADQIIHDAKGLVWSNNAFSLYVMDVKHPETLELPNDETPYWLQFSVIKGEGTINHKKFHQGESAIGIGSLEPMHFDGDMKVLISWIRK